jgi:hypothetical protein
MNTMSGGTAGTAARLRPGSPLLSSLIIRSPLGHISYPLARGDVSFTLSALQRDAFTLHMSGSLERFFCAQAFGEDGNELSVEAPAIPLSGGNELDLRLCAFLAVAFCRFPQLRLMGAEPLVRERDVSAVPALPIVALVAAQQQDRPSLHVECEQLMRAA